MRHNRDRTVDYSTSPPADPDEQDYRIRFLRLLLVVLIIRKYSVYIDISSVSYVHKQTKFAPTVWLNTSLHWLAWTKASPTTSGTIYKLWPPYILFGCFVYSLLPIPTSPKYLFICVIQVYFGDLHNSEIISSCFR